MAFQIAVVGTYPEGTFQRFTELMKGTDACLREIKTQEEFDTLEDADVILLRIIKMSRKDVVRFPSLKAILRWGVGYDSIDLEAAGERGIYVCNTPGVNAYAVAELTVMMMLTLGRRMFCYRDSINEGRWDKYKYMREMKTLKNSVVGIIGGGNIGRRVAQYSQVFGACTQYYDACRLKKEEEQKFHMQYVSFDNLLATSDFVTVHVPLLESTYHMIDTEQIEKMKDGAILINCARGGVINDEAAWEAVEIGKLGGLGIDTLENEPPEVNSEFRGNSRILVTPHLGGNAPGVENEAIPMISENMKRLIRGEKPAYIVNRQFLKSETQT